jgi:amino acid adenylation domain-containing protein
MRTVPIAPGIPDSALAEVIVLDYGDPGALEVLRAHGSELAAVLVEPVQSRRLDLQPREFLHQLRALTSEIGAALVFDEVVTGFRVHPGGAQAWFGVRADLAIYGKVVGGGLPIGVVTGDPKFMDALDGGQWQYGDDSFPEIGVTFFAGTFVRHPLALAAARAVLNHLRESGPALQERLAERAGQLASRLREVIDERGAPYRVSSFSSLIQMTFGPEQRFAGLVYYLLRERGIHIWENRAFVITTAHTDLDFDRLVDALRDSLDEMRAAGFLPTSAGRDEPWAAFPLTEAQREIWLAAQMAGDAATAYNESLRLEFRGPFDVDAFRQAARRIVERHPILLASIAADGESQRMRSDLAIEIPELDLTGEEASGREAGLEALIEAEVSTPFDLVHGPLLRVRMVRLSPEHHVVIWTAHHIVCDGWSGGLIVDELARIYSALTRGAQPALDAPLSFRDYAGASAAEGPEALEAMKYWQQQLSEPPPPLDLPTDRPRPPTRSVSAATVRRKLDGPLHEALRRTAARHKTTMVALLMAALDTLLYRLTGQTDLVVGLPVAGQPATGSECLVGHCVSLLPVRTRIRGEAAFAETLAEVRKGVLDAYEHHQCTIGGILRNIAVPRSPDRAPLVEVIFNLDRDPGEARFEGVEFSCERNPKRALHYDLFLNAVEGPGGLVLECDYNTGIFDPATMDRWLGHYETLLRSITQNPAGVTSRLEILEERERRELSVEWNDPPVRFPEGPSLQALFEAQVSRTPDARAVTFGEAHLTYRELDSRANQVAHHLIELGVGPEILVGLLLDRSVDMLVGMLGILKAGGAYVPMDPEYPLERIGQILEDSRTPLVVTRGSLSTILKGLTGPAGFTGQVVCMDLDWPVMARQSGQAPGTGVGPANLAYVLFTSGSTGRPKGVAIEHHSAVTFIRWALTVFGQEELAGVLFSTSVCFDLSVFEVFVPLSAGGRVILAPDVLQLPVLPARDEVTLLNTVPSAMMELVRVGGIPPSVTTVNLAGEALRETLVGDICSSTLVERVYNLYGPSEATTYSTFTEVRRGSKVTIGRPIANTRAYVLDGHLNPVPIGVHGELYLAGEGVARGYYGQPDLTRERFLSDPFEPGGGGRMYRTGDLCRWLPDRQLEYLGRMDHQVKLRGFRIELGEIEVALGRHPGVRQAVVVVGPDGSGAAQLVAYVVPEADPAPGAAELREHLRRSLPAFMIPSAIVTLEAIPTTPNGKIDRKSLPAPGRGQIELPIGSAVPRDPIEQGLARLWASVLGVDRIGVDDNFFETGGHSLLALRIVTGIEKTFGKRLPLSTLVQFPTIRELAALLRTNDWTPSWVSLVPIRPGGSRTPLFLMHSHGGNILEYYPLAKLLDADQPVYALQARGLDGHILPNQSIETMAASYVGELRGLQPEGPYVLGGFCFGGMVALEAARQLAGAGQRVALVIMIQTAHPSCGPFRADAGFLHRWWHRLVMRLDLERQLMRQAGPGYIAERGLHVCSVARARAMIAFDRVVVRGGDRPVRSSMAYILESLGIVHDRAYAQYTPRTYGGDVCIIRAASQFPALAGDPWLGWKDTLEGPPELHEVPGHQQNMMVEPNVPLLAEVINSRLRALAPSGDAGKPLDDPIAALAR